VVLIINLSVANKVPRIIGNSKMRAVSIFAIASVFAPVGAWAQVMNPNPGIVDDGFRLKYEDRGNNTSVRERARPNYDPAGIAIGAFTLRPTVELEWGTTDNIFRTSSAEESAETITVRPKFRLASNWSVHALEVYGGIAQTEAGGASTESRNEIEYGASGKLDIQRGSLIQATLRHFSGREQRGIIGSPIDTVRPIEYDETSGSIAGILELSRLRLAATVSALELDYDDVLLRNGTVLNQDDRDRNQSTLTLRSDFAVNPAFALFAQITWDERDYRSVAPPFVSRDSKGTVALVGANFDISNLARGEIGFGYVNQDYDAPIYGTTDGLGYRAALEWFPRRNITVAASATQSVEDSAVSGFGGNLTSTWGLQADYEWQPNIILTWKTLQTDVDYRSSSRSDVSNSTSLSGVYLLNRRTALSASLIKSSLSSSGSLSGPGFEDWRFWLRLVLRG
jgi:hypothetical protein